MIELNIRGETAGHLVAEFNHLAAVISTGAAMLQARANAQAQQNEQTASEAAGEAQATQTVTEAAQPSETTTKPRGRGRPPKAETKPEPTSTAAPGDSDGTHDQNAPAEKDLLDIPDQFKRSQPTGGEQPVPKNIDELRQLLQKVASAKSPDVTGKILVKYAPKTTLVPIEKYSELAAELYAALVA